MFDKSLDEILRDLWVAAGNLRALGKYKEANKVQRIRDRLDPNETKPAPLVPRTICG